MTKYKVAPTKYKECFVIKRRVFLIFWETVTSYSYPTMHEGKPCWQGVFYDKAHGEEWLKDPKNIAWLKDPWNRHKHPYVED